MQFEKRIKDLRIDNDFSQQFISENLGIDIKTYNRYENGLHEIKLNSLIKLAQLYNLSLDYISGISDIPRPLDEGNPINQTILSEKQKKLLKAYSNNKKFQLAIDKLLDLD